MSKTVKAEDLKTGDVFMTPETGMKRFVHLFGISDARHVSIWVVAIEQERYDANQLDEDHTFQMVKGMDVDVVDKRERAHVDHHSYENRLR